jgi:hypothetical protein
MPPKKQSQPEPINSEEQNAKMAMKAIRADIKRILDSWDPMCLRGLPGFQTEYNNFVGPLSVMARKRLPATDIAAHLDRLMQLEWRLPPDRPKCHEIAEKIRRTAAFLDP